MRKEYTDYHMVLCSEPKCHALTAHPNIKYKGPCHFCLAKKGDLGYKYAKLLKRSAKKGVSNSDFNDFSYMRAERWSF